MLQCRACDSVVDLCHLVVCPERYIQALHETLHKEMLDILLRETLSRPWATSHQHLSLIDLLDRLFSLQHPPSVSTDAVQQHRASLLCGAFSPSAQSHAIRVVGLAKFDDAPIVFQSLRLACIRTIQVFFATLHLSVDT